MKKALCCLVLALVLLVLSEPKTQLMIKQTQIEAFSLLQGGKEEPAAALREPIFSTPVDEQAASDYLDVTLYYRYGDTDALGMEAAQIDIRREETIARSIVERLIEGPDAAHGKLSGVFPRATQVLSVTGEGTTAYVTLSRDFLGRPDGAPGDWEDLMIWQEEATLRRYLAAQSIVCSLTEGGRYQRVQLFVAGSDDDVPERIPLYYFDLHVTNPSIVLSACSRDEAAILTPRRAMQMILDAWQRRDWEQLYGMLCAPEDGQMPTLSAFEAKMIEADVSLLTMEISGGTVDASGKTATIVLDGAIRSSEGGDAAIIRESVPFVRVADNWAMRLDTLLSLMIRE